MKLNNKRYNVIVTGGNQGLGLAIAKKFVLEGYNTLLVARDLEKLIIAREKLLKLTSKGQKIIIVKADISKTKECEKIFKTFLEHFKSLNVLINNAGIFGPMGDLTKIDWEAFVQNINVNLLGTIYMCRLAIPLLKSKKTSNIINISGGGAATPFPALAYYATGKAGLTRFSEELAEGLKKSKIDVNMVAPGPLNTRFVDIALGYGKENLGDNLFDTISNIRETGGSLENVADLCFYLSSNLCDNITGKFISARYDDWEKLHMKKKFIMQNEVFTMRRIDSFNIKKFSRIEI